MKSLFPEKYHRSIYVFALILLVTGLPLSNFLMSLSQLILAGNWFLEGNVKNKFISFWKNKPAVVVSSILLLHFIGLFYSADLDYGWKDIRIKSPLFILPVILSTSKPLSRKLFDTVLQFFIASIMFGTVVCTLVFFGIINNTIGNISGTSIFISHIIFALLICVAIFVSGYFMFNSINIYSKVAWLAVIVWLIFFLVLLKSLTGLFVLPISALIYVVWALLKSKKLAVKYVGLFFLLGTITFLGYKIGKVITDNNKKEVVDFTKLDKYTSRGNLYDYDPNTLTYENGNLIWVYYCDEELMDSWNKRSTKKIGSNEIKRNETYNILVRFLASKGWRKDADAVSLLTNDEVKAIEDGATNVNYQNIRGVQGRLYETLWEINVYKNNGDANGHSLTQRFEYWKTALSILKSNLIFGVGTGDVPEAFDQEYVKLNSMLAMEWRHTSHNQYLSIAVAFGIVGLLWFLITLLYPLLSDKNNFNYLYITFLIIALVSFITEDTLETQAGVTFFAFLNSFFLFGKEKDVS